MGGSDLTLRPRSVARVCAAAIAVLVGLHAASQFLRFQYGRDYQLGFAEKLYLGSEASIPNWFSTILLGTCAAILFAIAAAKKDRDAPYWRILGALFVVLSLDEAAALHDLASPFFAGTLTWLAGAVGGPFVALARKPNYAWEIPGAILCIVVAVAYIRFLMRLPRVTRNGIALAGALYVAGAIGVDFVEGWYSGLHGPKNPTFVALLTCEETLEMVGSSLFLYTLLRYLEMKTGELRIHLSGRRSAVLKV